MFIKSLPLLCAMALPLFGAPTRTSVPAGHLSLQVNGSGSISRFGFNTSTLEVGRQYTVAAVPGPSAWFAGWHGTLSTTNNPLTFIMQSNMVLRAEFVPSPFPAFRGEYNGLFYPADGEGAITLQASATNSGFVTLSVAGNGSFTGKLTLAGKSSLLAGSFNHNLEAHLFVPQADPVPLSVELVLDTDTSNVRGTVSKPSGFSSGLLALRAATTNANPYSGAYTLLLAGCDKNGACFLHARVPYGDSPATVSVSPSGAVQMMGSLADGTAISQKIKVSESGVWPLYIAPYGNRGLILGWLDFSAMPGSMTRVMWQKPPGLPCDKYYTNCFSSLRIALLSPVNSSVATNGFPSKCTVEINSGDLPQKLVSSVDLSLDPPSIDGGQIEDLSLTVNYEKGQFRGWFIHPLTQQLTFFRGVLNNAPPANASHYGIGGGWFVGPSGESGIVRLKP